jgi:hypothetical protein
MTVLDALKQRYHKPEGQRFANWIAEDTNRFDELMEFFFHPDARYNQRASTLLMYCFDDHPDLIVPYLGRLIDNLDNPQPDAVVRNTFRIFQFVDVPEEIHGKLIDKAFLYFGDPQQAIAIQVFAMTVLFNACKNWPELQSELVPMIEEKLPYSSTGFKNRAYKILKAIRSNSTKLS